jgi:hypothetical protein
MDLLGDWRSAGAPDVAAGVEGLPAASPILFYRGRLNPEKGREVKLDPEERVIAAALDQADLDDDANERRAEARIEFKRNGHAKVTITISRELVEQARALDLTTRELFTEALRLAVPGAFVAACPLPSRCPSALPVRTNRCSQREDTSRSCQSSSGIRK